MGGTHYHTGPISIYVLEGALSFDEQGKSRETFKAGALFEEPIGASMLARNMNTIEPTKILVIQSEPARRTHDVKGRVNVGALAESGAGPRSPRGE